MDPTLHHPPGQPLESRARPPGQRLSKAALLRSLVILAALLAAALVPGCRGQGDGDDLEDTSAAEDAITTGTNLALGKTATQSTLAWGGVPQRAVDGNTDGYWANGSVTHTDLELSPWWQVDLGASQFVGTVELFNRRDCCSDRLSNFQLLVSDDGSSWQSYNYPGTVGARVSMAVNRSARYVKVQLNSTGTANRILSLAEVKVYAPPNLAAGKVATQSSMAYGGDPQRAVDGNTDGNWANGSVTHSDIELMPWWQVDLGAVQGVSTVELWNRTDCCSGRLADFQLQLSDDGSTWQSFNYPGTVGTVARIDVNRSARYVKVQLNWSATLGWRYLSLAEVKVYEAANASPAGGSPSGANAPTAPIGAIDAKFSVDAQGAASYTIPIKVPPGTNGVEPRLSLAYRSAGQNGMVGMGWALAGIPSITRCPKTKAQDGYIQAVQGTNDAYCMDGQRLIVVGSSGTDVYYRTETESFSRVVSHSSGDAVNTPASFEATDRSGNLAVFGGTADSKPSPESGKPPLVWGLSKLTSPHGNYLTVAYTSSSGQLYPQQILYTMNDAVPSLKKRRVAFSYEARSDTELRYVAGAKLSTAQRLTAIKTYVQTAQGEVEAREYRLAYTTSPATKRSLLASVTECDAQGACLPSTQLTYQSAAGTQFNVVEPAGWTYQDSLRYDPGAVLLPGDYNGDGKTDFLRQERGNWGADAVNNLWVYFSNGDGTFNIVTASCLVNGVDHCQTDTSYDAGAYLYPMDIDGDGKTDVIRQEHGGWGSAAGQNLQAYLSNGDGSFKVVTIFDNSGDYDYGVNLIPGDFDGDGMGDVMLQMHGYLAWAAGGGHNYLLRSTGGGSFSGFNPAAVNSAVDPNGQDWFANVASRDPGAFFYAGDWNGDGMTDLLRQEHGDWDNDAAYQLLLYPATGNGQFNVVFPHDHTPDGNDNLQGPMRYDDGAFLIPGDFNGDGLTDLIRQEHGGWASDANMTFRVYFSDGAAGFDFVTPVGPQYQNDLGGDAVEIIPIDYNGDRKTDFIRRRKSYSAGANNFDIYVSRGDGTFDVIQPGNVASSGDWYQAMLDAGYTNLLPGDFDGDGKTDFLRQEKGAWASDTISSFQVFFAAGDRAPDSLKKITNGLGGTMDIQYAPLSDGSVYTRGSGATGTLSDVQNSMYVVKSYQTTAAPGQVVSRSYTYSGARTDRGGRGFLGFATVTENNASAGNVTTVEYNQWPFPLTGTVKSRTVKSPDGTAQLRTDNTYGTSNTYPGVYVVTLAKEEITHTEAGQSYKTVKEYEYDAYGNQTIVHDRGLDGDASDDRDTCTTYSDDPGLWRLDYPTYSRVGSSCAIVNGGCQCASVLEWIDRYYDWSVMNLTAVYDYDLRYGRWPFVQFTYDALGNVATRSMPGNSTRIVETNTYDPDYGTFLVAQTKAGGTLSLTTTSAYDPRFGVQVSRTDPNGNTAVTALDGLGRVVEKSLTSQDGYVVPTTRVIYGADGAGSYRDTDERNDWQADDWHWHRDYLDGSGRALHTVMQGADPNSPIYVDRTFDAWGEVATETLPRTAAGATVTQSYVRDWLGRLVQTTDAAGTINKFAYSIDKGACPLCAMKVVTTEASDTPQQRVWIRGNDPLGNTRLQIDPEGRVTSFGYDLVGRRTTVTDDAGTTTTVYDSLGRITSVSSPDRGTLTNEYGAGDWLSSTTDANGVVTTYTYDDLGRVAQKAVIGGETTTFAYDNPSYANGLGRLTSVKVYPAGQQTPSSTNDFAYTPDGAVATNALTIDGHAYTLTSTYDPQGRLRSLTHGRSDSTAHVVDLS
jgi:YD repeat-containing protein